MDYIELEAEEAKQEAEVEKVEQKAKAEALKTWPGAFASIFSDAATLILLLFIVYCVTKCAMKSPLPF